MRTPYRIRLDPRLAPQSYSRNKGIGLRGSYLHRRLTAPFSRPTWGRAVPTFFALRRAYVVQALKNGRLDIQALTKPNQALGQAGPSVANIQRLGRCLGLGLAGLVSTLAPSALQTPSNGNNTTVVSPRSRTGLVWLELVKRDANRRELCGTPASSLFCPTTPPSPLSTSCHP